MTVEAVEVILMAEERRFKTIDELALMDDICSRLSCVTQDI